MLILGLIMSVFIVLAFNYLIKTSHVKRWFWSCWR